MSPMPSRAKKAKEKEKAEARLRGGRRNATDDTEAINRAIANVMEINISVEANKGLKNNIVSYNGFDMTCIPEVYSSCSFSIMPEKDRIITRLIRFSVLATKEYNAKNKTNYVYTNYVKALSAPFNGSVFYIMVEAMQPFHSSPPSYFQTLVYEGIPAPDGTEALKVEFINMVSSPSPTIEEIHASSDDDDDYFDEMIAYNYYRTRDSNIVSYNGFDMTCIPEVYSCSFSIVPGDDSIIPQLIRFSKLAIEEYNIKNKTNYKYVKYVKALAALVKGFVFYIMFEAKQPSHSSPRASFQTLVYDGIPARDGTETLEIEFINMVSSPSPTKEEDNSCSGN